MFAIAYAISAVLVFWLAWEGVEQDNRALGVAGHKPREGLLVKILVASLFAFGPLAAGAALWHGWLWLMA